MLRAQIRLLHRLARSYGVATAFHDATGCCRHAAPQALLAALGALGAPVERLSDVSDALRERTREHWRQCCEPIVVAWNGRPANLDLRLPREELAGRVELGLELENGKLLHWICDLASLPGLEAVSVDGLLYENRRLSLPSGLPPGYHRLTLTLPARTLETLIIAAPNRAYTRPDGASDRTWGVFLPLYALQSQQSWGAGNFTDLESLLHWTRGLGGNFVGTLPLLSAFMDEPFAPSPYEPVSRLFWNEFYLDLTRVEEFKKDPGAQDLFNTPAFQAEMAALKAEPLVNYRRGMSIRRSILERCARVCFAEASERLATLRRWEEQTPAARDYARFRAATERRRAGWPTWPDRLRDGLLLAGDYDPEAERYHLYVQWLAHEQLRNISVQARQNGQGLYLDLPLGVHRAGYDVWRERGTFALEASTGAPPDAFFNQGQDWGFPPYHPERIREQGYRYYIAGLRHHLQHAAVLRLDHVMGLHRLYWVPKGLSAREGVYVHYRSEEFYAILALESQRYQTLIVGEDLGTVPGSVRTAMEQRQIYRMYVLPFELTEDSRQALRPVPAGALACLNTHDMSPFASFWLEQGKGARNRFALPVFLHRQGRLKVPTTHTKAVFRACLAHLATSRAQILLLNLEDLWLERAPQNIPGTTDEYPNWRQKACHALEAFSHKPEVLGVLEEINQLRKAQLAAAQYCHRCKVKV